MYPRIFPASGIKKRKIQIIFMKRLLLLNSFLLIAAFCFSRTIVVKNIEELNKANNRFIEPLKNLRKTEIGAITAGSFILTPDNDLFPVYLYMPNSNDGTLAYTVEGSDGDRRYVTLSFPTTRELYRLKTYDEFELKSYLHSEVSNKVALNQLYRLGFQLQGTDPGRVTVTYVARIRPILEEH